MPTHIQLVQSLCTIGMFFNCVYLPIIERGYVSEKPRLEGLSHVVERLERMMRSPPICRAMTRFSPNELRKLTDQLLIDEEYPTYHHTGKWRFTPFHKFCIFLIWFSNYWPARSFSHTYSWAANSITNNARWWIHQIIEVLDSPNSGQCSSNLYVRMNTPLCSHILHCFSFVLTAEYAIRPWTLDEQDEWIAHPTGSEEFHHCIGIVDATYVEIERPKDPILERRCYSTYKKCHALFFLAIIDRTGKRYNIPEQDSDTHELLIQSICMFPLSPGKFRVLDCGNTPVGTSEAVALVLSRPWLRPGLKLLGDVAYAYDKQCVCPWTRRQMAGKTAEEIEQLKKYNRRLSSVRQRVEHQFARMKNVFGLLQSAWPYHIEHLASTVRAAALLCNWMHRERGLYQLVD